MGVGCENSNREEEPGSEKKSGRHDAESQSMNGWYGWCFRSELIHRQFMVSLVFWYHQEVDMFSLGCLQSDDLAPNSSQLKYTVC